MVGATLHHLTMVPTGTMDLVVMEAIDDDEEDHLLDLATHGSHLALTPGAHQLLQFSARPVRHLDNRLPLQVGHGGHGAAPQLQFRTLARQALSHQSRR